MTANVRPKFYEDVAEKVAYLAAKAGDIIALAWAESGWLMVQELLQHPGLGRERKDLPFSAVRSWRVNGFTRWLIFYGERVTELVFYRVRHGAMNLIRLDYNS
jgi:plasmid stabilization system protein ParE